MSRGFGKQHRRNCVLQADTAALTTHIYALHDGGVTPHEWRDRVGRRIEQQRGRLSVRSAAKRAGISEGLWRQIESGQRPIRKGEYETVNPKPETRAWVCQAIGWTDDSIDRLLAGEEPIPSGAPLSSLDDEELDRLRVDALRTIADLSRRVVALEGAVNELLGQARRQGSGG